MFTRSALRDKSLYILISIIVIGFSFSKIADLDFWWHLKTGQVILQQKAFQYKEIYSFTVPGREYIDHEWLFQVLQYFAYSLAGPAGITLFKSFLLATIYCLCIYTLRKNCVSPTLTTAVLFLSIAGAVIRFIERPEVFTTLFLVLTYVVIDNFLRSGRRSLLYLLPPIYIFWANTHAAVILGLLLQITFLGGLIVESHLQKSGYPGTYFPQKNAF